MFHRTGRTDKRLLIAVILIIAFCWVVQSEAGLIYTFHGSNRLGMIETTTGTGTDIGHVDAYLGAYGAAFDADGILYVSVAQDAKIVLATADTETAAGSKIGMINDGFHNVWILGLEVADNDTIYGVGYVSGTTNGGLYTLNKATGIATKIGDTGVSDPIIDIAFDSNGTLWGVTGGTDIEVYSKIWTIDTSSGTATYQGTINGLFNNPDHSGLSGIMFGENDILYAIQYMDNSPLYIINTSTWEAKVVGHTGLNRPIGGDIFTND